MGSAFASYGATGFIRPMGPTSPGRQRLGALFDLMTSAARVTSSAAIRLGSFGSLAPPGPVRSFALDLRRMCPRLAILGSAGVRRSDEWAAGERRSVAESDFRQITGFTFQREIFAERKERVAVPHENPA
jgi:hypothetical protein